jgi:hypothetical protein
VKRYIKKSSATIFCLSNRLVQAVFRDGSELYIDSKTKNVTYMDPIYSEVKVFSQDEAKNRKDKEFIKRLKYLKECLAMDKPPEMQKYASGKSEMPNIIVSLMNKR